METFFHIVEIASCILTLSTLAMLFIKPIREKVFNTRRTLEGERCLLRSEMLKIYYRNLENETIKQYEFENYIKLYEAYKSLGGNSFIDEINEEIRHWKVMR